jgi:hypothetical protein
MREEMAQEEEDERRRNCGRTGGIVLIGVAAAESFSGEGEGTGRATWMPAS